ncbi:MAG TPA: 2-dehydropantoate 2-reductase N-terminal domain-containing protein, partial [Clostridia bacterium]|nr:2-dehydropantoate 2-reductase N-terminal domain-containing protein [Clostridia bacterium]
MKIIVLGAGGAIGSCLSGWLTETDAELYLYDKPSVCSVLREKGITLYKEHKEKKNYKVNVIDKLSDVQNPDVVVVVVKNYSLEPVSELIKREVSGNPVILAMQNGVENQKILPKYFDKVVYCVIEFNAWLDEVGVGGYQNKGPFVIGTPDGSLQKEMAEIAAVFNQGVETIVTDRIVDAAYCKM